VPGHRGANMTIEITRQWEASFISMDSMNINARLMFCGVILI
jgi:hypothetical protein